VSYLTLTPRSAFLKGYRTRDFKLLRSPGIDSASNVAWRAGTTNPIPTRFLAPIDCSKIPALTSCGAGSLCRVKCGRQPLYFCNYLIFRVYTVYMYTLPTCMSCQMPNLAKNAHIFACTAWMFLELNTICYKLF
jgi:hypothetical protein